MAVEVVAVGAEAAAGGGLRQWSFIRAAAALAVALGVMVAAGAEIVVAAAVVAGPASVAAVLAAVVQAIAGDDLSCAYDILELG